MKARLPKEFQNNAAPSNMNGMIKQAQKMQDDIKVLQDEIEKKDFTVTAGGGMIEIIMSGGRVMKSVKIDPEIVDKENISDLEDIIIAGVNSILTKIDDESAAEMEKITGGVSFPGLF